MLSLILVSNNQSMNAGERGRDMLKIEEQLEGKLESV